MYRLFSTINKKPLSNNPPINITDTAWKKIGDILRKSTGQGMLFSATGGGCHGFYYNLEIMRKSDSGLSNSKIKITCLEKDDSKVYIDSASEMFLLGTTIDYIEEDYQIGVYESKFVYKADKNIATNCGCGVSFSPK
jgi:iron-sulfur cluster assembly accessory protein